MQVQIKPHETWIKILSKRVITIPKEFREKLGLEEGDIAKAKIEGDKLVIQSRKVAQYAEYRTYSKEELDQFEKEDQLPEPLASKVEKSLSNLP